METLSVSVEKVVTEFSEEKKLIHFSVKFLVWNSIVGSFGVLLLFWFSMVTQPGWVI